jgi:hypothetical protein
MRRSLLPGVAALLTAALAGTGALTAASGPFRPRISAMTSGYQRTSSPVTALPMIMRWISEVPSKIVKILASRCQRSTGYSRV